MSSAISRCARGESNTQHSASKSDGHFYPEADAAGLTRRRGRRHFRVGLCAWLAALIALIAAKASGHVATPWSVVLFPLWAPLPAVVLFHLVRVGLAVAVGVGLYVLLVLAALVGALVSGGRR